MSEVFVGLGSNLGDRRATLRRALADLDAAPGVRVCAVSRVHETEPLGGPPQPRYLNAVARLEASLAPRVLLRLLQRVEYAHGRRRTLPDGPRTLDLDLLLYGAHRVDAPELAVPHPRMAERAFVLGPLAELAPRLAVDGTPVAERLRALEAR